MFLIFSPCLGETSVIALESESSDGIGFLTCFIERETDLDLGDFEEAKGLGLELDLGIGWEGRVEEGFGMIRLIILPLL